MALVVCVAGLWVSTLAPRKNPDGGATCIEEPLVGMSAGPLSSPGCVTANQGAVLVSVLLAVVVALVGVSVVRAAARRRTSIVAAQGGTKPST